MERTPQLCSLLEIEWTVEGAPPPSAGWVELTIMIECTPESGHCQSTFTLLYIYHTGACCTYIDGSIGHNEFSCFNYSTRVLKSRAVEVTTYATYVLFLSYCTLMLSKITLLTPPRVWPLNSWRKAKLTGRQLPPLFSVLYRIISKRRYILAAQLLLREKSGT
jgi:hypothetical protein